MIGFSRVFVIHGAAIALLALPCHSANVCTGDISELADFGKLAYLRDSVCTQVSSFDRTGGNDDGFSGRYSYTRIEDGHQVIFDADGPGCIYRLWSAEPNDQKIEFFFDGSASPGLVFDNWKDMFLNKVFPFLEPFSRHFIGGWCSYIPIPFEKRCKIVSHGEAKFLQITWQKFASADGVKTFSTDFSDEYKAKYEAVKKVWEKPSTAPWGDQAPAGWVTHKNIVTIPPGKSATILGISGAGVVRKLTPAFFCDDPEYYRKCVLEVYTDGERGKPDVWSPVGDLFLDGFTGWAAGRSVVIGYDGRCGHYSYWPMPFAKGIEFRIINESNGEMKASLSALVEPMTALPQDMGRFHAWWHRENPTRMGKGFEMLTATGRGHFCGVNHYMQSSNGQVSFLEGDEKAWIDDRDNTYYNGTGTEDYFNGGWYFGGTGGAPLYGCLVEDGGAVDAYRFHLTDLIPFQNKAHIEIEHGSANNFPADYAGVTFWYAEPGSTHTFEKVAASGRILDPRKNQNAVEAEQGFYGGGPFVEVEHAREPLLMYSEDKAVVCHAKKPGGLIMTRVGFEATSPYRIRAQVGFGPDYGKVAVLLDGKRIGQVVDCYAPIHELRVVTFAEDTPLIKASGDHTLTFKVVGKSSRSKGCNEAIDALYITRNGLIEGERMRVRAKSENAHTSTGRMGKAGPNWSNGEQAHLGGHDKGDWFELDMPVAKPGRYNIGAYFMKGPKSPRVNLSLDGTLIGEDVDLYDAETQRAPMMRFGGEYDLAAGKHMLRIEIVGKNKESKGYGIGLDAMSLEPVKP